MFVIKLNNIDKKVHIILHLHGCLLKDVGGDLFPGHLTVWFAGASHD
jgi:hypothetical protein